MQHEVSDQSRHKNDDLGYLKPFIVLATVIMLFFLLVRYQFRGFVIHSVCSTFSELLPKDSCTSSTLLHTANYSWIGVLLHIFRHRLMFQVWVFLLLFLAGGHMFSLTTSLLFLYGIPLIEVILLFIFTSPTTSPHYYMSMPYFKASLVLFWLMLSNGVILAFLKSVAWIFGKKIPQHIGLGFLFGPLPLCIYWYFFGGF